MEGIRVDAKSYLAGVQKQAERDKEAALERCAFIYIDGYLNFQSCLCVYVSRAVQCVDNLHHTHTRLNFPIKTRFPQLYHLGFEARPHDDATLHLPRPTHPHIHTHTPQIKP